MMRRPLGWLVAGLVLVAVPIMAGCGLLRSGPSSPHPGPPPAGPSRSTAHGGSPTVTGYRHPVTGWASADGHITCAGLVDAHGGGSTAVRCDIDKAGWQPPAKPSSCHFEWGQSIEIANNRPQFACVSDPVLETAVVGQDSTWWYVEGGQTVIVSRLRLAVLQDGTKITIHRLVCASEEQAMVCTVAGTGHGFMLSSAAYSLF